MDTAAGQGVGTLEGVGTAVVQVVDSSEEEGPLDQPFFTLTWISNKCQKFVC